jgi:diacylglycerol kinase family enzyme
VTRRVAVLLNPSAGSARDGIEDQVVRLFAAAGCDARVMQLNSSAHAVECVRTALAEGADTIAAGGGDGTISSVAAALIGSSTPLGVLPLGTLNHFAKDLGIPAALEAAVSTIATGADARVDAGEVNGVTFLNNSSIGIYPDIVVERESLRGRGYRKWTALALASARIIGRYSGVVVRLTAGGVSQVIRTPFLMVGNNQYEIEGTRMGARSRLDRGELSAYLAPRLRGRDLPRLAALALLGRVKDNPVLESFVTDSLTVEAVGRRRLRVARDGEVAVMTTPLRYRILRGALVVKTPGG